MKPIATTAAVSAFIVFLSSSLGNMARAQTAGIIDQPRPLVMAMLPSAVRPTLIAGMGISIRNLAHLSEGRRVRLFGTVQSMQGARNFVLKDETGEIKVRLASNMPADMAAGSEVSVAGRFTHNLFGEGIQAQSVMVLDHAVAKAEPQPPALLLKAAARKNSSLMASTNTPDISTP